MLTLNQYSARQFNMRQLLRFATARHLCVDAVRSLLNQATMQGGGDSRFGLAVSMLHKTWVASCREKKEFCDVPRFGPQNKVDAGTGKRPECDGVSRRGKITHKTVGGLQDWKVATMFSDPKNKFQERDGREYMCVCEGVCVCLTEKRSRFDSGLFATEYAGELTGSVPGCRSSGLGLNWTLLVFGCGEGGVGEGRGILRELLPVEMGCVGDFLAGDFFERAGSVQVVVW